MGFQRVPHRPQGANHQIPNLKSLPTAAEGLQAPNPTPTKSKEGVLLNQLMENRPTKAGVDIQASRSNLSAGTGVTGSSLQKDPQEGSPTECTTLEGLCQGYTSTSIRWEGQICLKINHNPSKSGWSSMCANWKQFINLVGSSLPYAHNGQVYNLYSSMSPLLPRRPGPPRGVHNPFISVSGRRVR